MNVETSEIVKVESERMQRDHLYDVIKTVATKLMKDATLPPLSKPASDQRMNRQVPTEALTFYSRALLYQDRGERGQGRRHVSAGDRGVPRVRGSRPKG